MNKKKLLLPFYTWVWTVVKSLRPNVHICIRKLLEVNMLSAHEHFSRVKLHKCSNKHLESIWWLFCVMLIVHAGTSWSILFLFARIGGVVGTKFWTFSSTFKKEYARLRQSIHLRMLLNSSPPPPSPSRDWMVFIYLPWFVPTKEHVHTFKIL